MVESVRDLAAWYPFMPNAAEKPWWADRILDMRLVITLPEAELDDQDEGLNEDLIKVYLKSFSPTTATISLLSPVLPADTEVEVPVYAGRDSMPTSQSYIIVDSDFSDSESDCGTPVHPACFILLQRAPKLGFMTRTKVSSIDGTSDQSDSSGQSRIDGADYSDSTVYYPDRLENGNNVEIYVTGDSIVFSASPGAGTGVYTTPPYTDVQSYSVDPSRGLRSINGLSGTVMLANGPSVDESTSYDEPTITVRLAPSSESD